MEQKNLSIVETVSKGITYRNIYLKTKVKVDGLGEVNKTQGIDPGNFIIVEKLFDAGRKSPFGTVNYKVKWDGQDVGFSLTNEESIAFDALGKRGSKVKITLNAKPYAGFEKDGKKIPAGIKRYPVFELVE